MTRKRVIVFAVILLGIAALSLSMIFFTILIHEKWLIWQLESEDKEVRAHAAASLGEMRSIRAIPKLVKLFETEPMIKEGNAYGLSFSGKALTKIGRPVIPVISKYLEHKESNVTVGAAFILSAVFQKARQGVPKLISMLQHEEPFVRLVAATTLGNMGELARPAVAPLTVLLEDEYSPVRRSTAEALRSITPLCQYP